jgi:hypothetical protein
VKLRLPRLSTDQWAGLIIGALVVGLVVILRMLVQP